MVGNTVSEACLLEDDRPVFRNDGKVPDIAGVPALLLENWDDRNTLPVLTERVVWYDRPGVSTEGDADGSRSSSTSR